MPANHPHPDYSSGPPPQPSWGPSPMPLYPATAEPSGRGGKVWLAVLIVVGVLVALGLAGAAFFLVEPFSRESDAARPTVVETLTEFVDPPAAGAGDADTGAVGAEPRTRASASARPEYPDLPANATAVSSDAAHGAPAGSFHNVYTGSGVTSHAFAQEVGQAYRAHHRTSGQLNATVTAYSPVTGQSYTMTCRDNGSYVTCTGGNNAVVYLS